MASNPARPPDAFLSYTRFDDRHDGGAISEFCRRLASAVRAVTGAPFEIFQDVGGIGIGEHWPGKLDHMLDEARFFIPVLTPSYFTSNACRDELEKFLHAEAERQRNDLVLPIYYIESEVLEDEDLCAADPLASTLHERQRQDWRELRFEPFEAVNVRRALERLARDIVKARRRVMLSRMAFTRSGTPGQPKQSPSASSSKPVIPASELPATLTWSQALHWLAVGKLDDGDLELELALKEAWSQQTGEPAPPQRLPFEQARSVLLGFLESGKAVATGRRVSAIGASALEEESLSSEIPVSGWPDLRLDDASSFAHLAHASVSGQGYADVRLKREDVIKALQGALSEATRSTSNGDDQLSLKGTRPSWTTARRQIFLAHAREDKVQVRKLYADLKSRGLHPWLDEIDLVPGQIWKEEIPKAIRQAGVFLACLSSRSVHKVGYVQNEFRLALSQFGERPPGWIYLIPIRLDECVVPDLQIPERGLSLRDIHWVDLWEEGSFDRLVKAIEYALESARTQQLTSRSAAAEQLASRDAALRAILSSEFQPGTVFRDVDAPWCPEMVVIPPGEFAMGSTEAERRWAVERDAQWDWVDNEKPQHRVRIAYPLAVGRFTVTFDQYDRFARITRRAEPGDEGWGRCQRPVVRVSWEDVKAYAEWLAAETGQPYRLLSEAEWEYACRAGTTTRYWWGDEITPENANYGENIGRTSEVGTYPANPWGLHDTHGNVWEWVEDCWNDSYEGAPADGSPWTQGDCGRRVLRGGTWRNQIWDLRSAKRFGVSAGEWKDDFGFRVARTLTY